ncbi:DedA family protein, partial [Serratia marcescens]
MDELTHIIAKYSPEPEMLLLLIFLFALGKSVIFVSSILPPASITLLMGIVAGKHALPLGAVWAAIALGA